MLPTPASLPTPAARPWRALLVCAVAWLMLCLLLVLGIGGDLARAGRHVGLASIWWEVSPSFPPYILLSWSLHLHAKRSPERWVRTGQMLGLYLISMAVFVPVWLFYQAGLSLLQHGQPLADIWQALTRQRWFYRIYDFILASSAFIAQAGISALQLARARERAWRRAQTDNLQLRLSLLQGQLEPHFLFNTLNGISALVRANDRSNALTALSRVSELLRHALRASRARELSVQDELQFLRDYAELQGLRFGAGLLLHWRVEEETWDAYACPPLLFQPLLENAIRHGLEAGDGHGRVELRLLAEAGELRLHIANQLPDGPGSVVNGHGMGLATTRERLRMLYGSAASLEAGAQDGWYRVHLRMPLKELNLDEPRPPYRPDR